MGNVHNSVNNDSVSHSVNIGLPTKNSNAANSTCAFESIIENPINLSAHKVEDIEEHLFRNHILSSMLLF